MNYRNYNPTKVEESLIARHFKLFLSDNDVSISGKSQLEVDFYFEVFKTGWIMARAYTD